MDVFRAEHAGRIGLVRAMPRAVAAEQAVLHDGGALGVVLEKDFRLDECRVVLVTEGGRDQRYTGRRMTNPLSELERNRPRGSERAAYAGRIDKLREI
jgi:hypothetical protein